MKDEKIESIRQKIRTMREDYKKRMEDNALKIVEEDIGLEQLLELFASVPDPDSRWPYAEIFKAIGMPEFVETIHDYNQYDGEEETRITANHEAIKLFLRGIKYKGDKNG